MRHCLHAEWFGEYENDGILIVRNRLAHVAIYPFREKIAFAGIARCREIANYLCQFDDYFASKLQFRRWLNTVAFRESLRLLLQLETIEAVLIGLSAEQRQALHWSYVDQLTIDEVARVLNFTKAGPRFFDSSKAYAVVADAYICMCSTLAKRFHPKIGQLSTVEQCKSVLPLPPNLSCREPNCT